MLLWQCTVQFTVYWRQCRVRSTNHTARPDGLDVICQIPLHYTILHCISEIHTLYHAHLSYSLSIHLPGHSTCCITEKKLNFLIIMPALWLGNIYIEWEKWQAQQALTEIICVLGLGNFPWICLWANSVIESPSAFVCVSVCLSVM